ncbi:iron-containing alcohol dehydrogenase [Marivita hallyeonensis]|uniref:Uncharacterized protein n=1 Tax=Marivita hallyeonensis TaxID=996342 RepID=A0A1M5P172_9RHOB|nr:iron-containing alcohol dehydrogenase [Marivita hallyeonensis]SHG95179.1 hypothetical protein SAMN05443551_1110 [Marivita hallyeonensis]
MNFVFATAADIRFGRGSAKDTAEAAARISGRALVVHGRNPLRANWLLEDLHQLNVTATGFPCAGEPDLETVEKAVTFARDLQPGVVIGLGGGSVIDLAKAVAALTPARRATTAFLEVVGEALPLDAEPLPLIALPTTAGTGAEVTKNAVIGVPSHRRKVSLRDIRMIPNIAIVDPALTDGAPASVTFASGFDAITQVIESYVSVNASPLTDALCRDAIPRGLRALMRLSLGEDAAARDDMAFTSLVSGIALANAGLGAVHGLAGVIGGQTGAAHGEICATLLPHVLAYNASNAPTGSVSAGKHEMIFRHISEVLKVAPEEAPHALNAQIAALGIRNLAKMGVTPSNVSDIAAAAKTTSSSKNNPVPPDMVDFEAILRAAL